MDAPMADRRPQARIALLLILIGLGMRFIQTAAGEPAPAQAQVLQPAGPRALLRVGWLAACPTPAAEAGLYALPDAPCQPTRRAPLAWLQEQAPALGLLADGDYLTPGTAPGRPACQAQVHRRDGGLAGWLCADGQGLYRLTEDGGAAGARWQVWSDGVWQLVN